MNEYAVFMLSLPGPRSYERVIEDEHGLVCIWHDSSYYIVPTVGVSTLVVNIRIHSICLCANSVSLKASDSSNLVSEVLIGEEAFTKCSKTYVRSNGQLIISLKDQGGLSGSEKALILFSTNSYSDI
jgi:hypothetical protein